MIRIDKSGQSIPEVLSGEGNAKKEEHVQDYESAPDGFALNTKERTKFEFERDIYGHHEVKSLLKTIQGHKCCFCEAKITHISHGDIEHFRPKAGYKQDANDTIHYPGYFWLAYDWQNLYLACEVCNGIEKGNFFPLENPANRADPHTRNVEQEEPTLIDPGGSDDPEDHIEFLGPDPKPVSNSDRGRKTIANLGLDRGELVEHRRPQLNRLKTLEELVQLTQDSENSAEAKKRFFNSLRISIQRDSEYSNMMKSNFREYFEYL